MIKVTFGEHDRCDDKVRPESRFVLRAISQQFSFSNFDNDIALLRLNDRVPITDFIRPICLPSKKCKRRVLAEQRVYNFGRIPMWSFMLNFGALESGRIQVSCLF